MEAKAAAATPDGALRGVADRLARVAARYAASNARFAAACWGQSWDAVSYDAFLGRLTRGQVWGFRLAANPVRAVAREGARSKVLPHVTPAQQVGWLDERSAGWGFSLVGSLRGGTTEETRKNGVLVSQRHDDRFGRAESVAGRRSKVTLRIAQFDGTLEVTDAQALRCALVAGMGRAKGYGCGLMTLRPVEG